MKISVIGAGNVGMAIAADMSINGNEVSLLKSSSIHSESFIRLLANDNRLCLKEKGKYTEAKIKKVTTSLEEVKKSRGDICNDTKRISQRFVSGNSKVFE